MATASILPTPVPVNLTVLDPLSADITVVCSTITAVCTLLCTPAGQKLLEAQIALGNTIEQATTNLFGKIWNGITGLLGKIKL